jgi:hypothetical protein
VATIRGGDRFEKALAQISAMLRTSPTVARVGFLENAKYPDGTPVAAIALIQDMGAPGAGIPPRPFFRNMIAAKQAEWPPAIARLLRENNYDARVALGIAGAAIAGQLRESIINTNDPPLAESTIRRKGFAKALIDSSHMINSVDFEIDAR